jgi:hypothetical protein
MLSVRREATWLVLPAILFTLGIAVFAVTLLGMTYLDVRGDRKRVADLQEPAEL